MGKSRDAVGKPGLLYVIPPCASRPSSQYLTKFAQNIDDFCRTPETLAMKFLDVLNGRQIAIAVSFPKLSLTFTAIPIWRHLKIADSSGAIYPCHHVWIFAFQRQFLLLKKPFER